MHLLLDSTHDSLTSTGGLEDCNHYAA
jgi:hypothetical protein